MEMDFGWAHATLPVWVLAATTTAASVIGVLGTLLLGARRPATRLCAWLLRAVAALFVFSCLFFTGVLAHLYLYASEPRLRGHSVSICFGDPHWNMAFGVLIPPLAASVAFLLARRRHRRAEIPSTSAPSRTPAGA